MLDYINFFEKSKIYVYYLLIKNLFKIFNLFYGYLLNVNKKTWNFLVINETFFY